MSQNNIHSNKKNLNVNNVETLSAKFKLIIDSKLQSQIAYLHNAHPNLEWCGMLFYDVEEGNLEDVNSLVLRAKYLYLIDVGTSGGTSGELDEKIFDFYEEYPDAMNMRMGFIHTHHSMSAFFSSTDISELCDNTKFYNHYLSLIVNHKSQYCAKIATVSKHTSVNTVEFPGDDDKNIVHTETNTNSKIVSFDADIEFDIPEYFVDHHLEINSTSFYSNSGQSSYKSDNAYDGSHYPQYNLWGDKEHNNRHNMKSNSSTEFDNESEIFKTFNVKYSEEVAKNTLKKIFKRNSYYVSSLSLPTVITETYDAFKRATSPEQERQAREISDMIRRIIIKEFGLFTFTDESQTMVIAEIADKLEDIIYDSIDVPSQYDGIVEVVITELNVLEDAVKKVNIYN